LTWHDTDRIVKVRHTIAGHALAEGYDNFIVTDASGGTSVEGHAMAIRRVVAACAVPISSVAVLSRRITRFRQ
jgi:nicotinamidase-related amidase